MPTQIQSGSNIQYRVPKVTKSDYISDPLNLPETVTYKNSLYKIHADKNAHSIKYDYLGLHDSIITNENRELYDINLLVTENEEIGYSPTIHIYFNKNCMTELKLLDDTDVLCLFDTGSNVNLISETVYQNSPYLQSLPVRNCPKQKIFNTSSPIETDRFIEICFKIKDDYIMQTTALIVPDFGNVKFILSSGSMTQLKSIINMSDLKITVHKKSFLFRTFTHVKLKAHSSIVLPVKCSLPKHLRDGEFLCRAFRPFIKNLPESFILKFTKGKSFLKIANPTSKSQLILSNTALGSVNFTLTKNITRDQNIITHYHTDLDRSVSFCTMAMDQCPILSENVMKTNFPTTCTSDNTHVNGTSIEDRTQGNVPQYDTKYTYSSDIPICPSYGQSFMNFGVCQPSQSYSGQTTESLQSILEHYYKCDQDNMTTSQIYDLKRKTFPYLPSDDLRLKLSDKVIIEKDLDLHTDTVLTATDRETVKDLFYSLRECLSTHDNPSIQNKAFVSLKPVNLKPFYIRPYLTHDKEIKFAEKEMEKLRLMGILQRGSSEFLSPVMLIPKAHSGSKLSSSPEYRLVVDFKFLNSHLPDVKFSYPEIKHILHKIGRGNSTIFSVLDLKNAFFSINLDKDSIKYTSCCASPGSPVYQFRKLAQGLKPSPAFFTALMNEILSELPNNIRDYIECIMDDCIIFTPDLPTHIRVMTYFLNKLKEYGLLLTLNKVHAFRHSVKYMGLLLSSKDNIPTIKPLGSRIQSITNLPIPITARGIKSFIGCIIFLSQFLPKLSHLIKPINDILKKSNNITKEKKIKPKTEYSKGKGTSRKKSPDIQTFWKYEHTMCFNEIKSLITKLPVLHLPNIHGEFLLECDSSAKFVGSVLYQIQHNTRHVIAYFSSVMPDAACRYSSSEIELCGLKKSILHFKYLLKYSKFSVLMDHSALKRIYISKKPPKTNRIQKFLEELSDFSFTIEHQSGKHMFVSDFLSRFSSPDIENTSIPYLTSTSSISSKNYMTFLDNKCNFNYTTGSGNCSNHSFPLTRSQAKTQKVILPDLFQKTTKKSVKTPVQQVPKPVPPPRIDPPVRRSRGRPSKLLHTIPEEIYAEIPISEHSLPARPLFVPRAKPLIAQSAEIPQTSVPETIQKRDVIQAPDLQAISDIKGHMPSDRNELSKLLHSGESDLSEEIPEIEETILPVDISSDFEPLIPLSTEKSRNLQIKTRKDIPKQNVINKLLDLLNKKSTHFYHLPFTLDALRKSQRQDAFYAPLIQYLESNHLPANNKKQLTIIAECENYILFNDLFYHLTMPSNKVTIHKIALCIPHDLSQKIFGLYHSGLLTSHQGLTKTFYKIRQDFYIKNLYKSLYLYIMSCRICSARRDIPFNQKSRSWCSSVITDFSIMQSLSMDLKVMPTSLRGYNYLLVIRCNHSRFLVTDALKSRKASEVVESLFQTVICQHGTNIKEIYCDLDTAFKNEIMNILSSSLNIKIKFCSVQSHQSNPAERSIQSISKLLLHYIAKYGNKWCLFHKAAAFCLNTFPIIHLQNVSPYQIVFGREPPVLSDIQSASHDLTSPKFYNFSDYLNFLQDRFKHIRKIVQEQHNNTVSARQIAHGSESPAFRTFHEGDIVYCFFPSKTIMSEHKLPSKKLKMEYVGPLYIYSRYDKYLYILATIDGVVIEQIFHLSRLKKGLLRLSNDVTVNNINDLNKEQDKQKEMITKHISKLSTEKCRATSAHQFATHSPNADLWYHDAKLLVQDTVFQVKPTDQHLDLADLNTELKHMEINYTFHMSEQCQHVGTCNISKGRYKYGVLEVFCLPDKLTCSSGLWISIPNHLELDYLDTLRNLHIIISGSKDKYINKLFHWF
jgi:hypothetical protein